MFPGFKPPDTRYVKEALKYFGVAFIFFVFGTLGLVWNSSNLARGNFAAPEVIGGLHLMTLGWLSLSIFAALQVFVGVALGAQLSKLSLAPWIRRIWSLSVLLFACGLALQEKFHIVSGVLGLGLALVLFSIQLVPALWKAKRGHLTRWYAVISLCSLITVWLLGGAAAFVRAGTYSASHLPPGYLSAHILIAIFGWVGAMIVGVGSHLVPMFALSRATTQWPVRLALPIWILIPAVGAISAVFPTPWLQVGWSLAALGSILWVIQFALFIVKRVRKERDPGLLLAALSTTLLPVAWVVYFLTPQPIVFVGLLVFGWLSLFTFGIYHRVIPFLVWFLRFSGGMGRWRLPRVKDLLNERLSMTSVVLSILGIIIWAAGLGLAIESVVFAGATLLFTSTICGALQLRSLTRSFDQKPLSGKKEMPANQTTIHSVFGRQQ